MARKARRYLKKQQNRQKREIAKIQKQIKSHQNNPALQRINEKELKNRISKPITQAKAIGQKVDNFIVEMEKQFADIETNGFNKYIYKSIIQAIHEKVNALKPYTLYARLERPNIEIPEALSDGKVFELIDKEYNADHVYTHWSEEYATNIRETENWNYDQLHILDMNLSGHKEYLGINNASQFAKNFEAAAKIAGDVLDVNDEFNKIVNEEVLVDDNNATHTFQRIIDKFNTLAEEIFYESDQIREQIALNADNKLRTTENMSKAEVDKLFGRT